MQEDAELIRTVISQYDLNIAAFQDLEGLVARHPWLGLGHIPTGRYDLVHATPAADKLVARVDTLVVANPSVRRAERVALLMLLSAELPGFVRANPPKYTATALPLAAEARQYFIKGEPELADLYFPWLVASILGLLHNGGDDTIQRIERDQPISALADRCCTREARETAQGAYRSRVDPCPNSNISR